MEVSAAFAIVFSRKVKKWKSQKHKFLPYHIATLHNRLLRGLCSGGRHPVNRLYIREVSFHYIPQKPIKNQKCPET
jgi:hypothetical protein